MREISRKSYKILEIFISSLATLIIVIITAKIVRWYSPLPKWVQQLFRIKIDSKICTLGTVFSTLFKNSINSLKIPLNSLNSINSLKKLSKKFQKNVKKFFKVPQPADVNNKDYVTYFENLLYELKMIKILLCKNSLNEEEVKNYHWRTVAQRINWTQS